MNQNTTNIRNSSNNSLGTMSTLFPNYKVDDKLSNNWFVPISTYAISKPKYVNGDYMKIIFGSMILIYLVAKNH